MSLKAIHVVFIVVATLFTTGFGVWSIDYFLDRREAVFLMLGVLSLVGSLALVGYGGWFLKKMKDVSYL